VKLKAKIKIPKIRSFLLRLLPKLLSCKAILANQILFVKWFLKFYPKRTKEQYSGAKRPVSEISKSTRFSASTASPAVIVQLFTY